MNSAAKGWRHTTIRPLKLLASAVCVSALLLCLLVLMMRHFGPLIVASYIYSEQSALILNVD